MIDRDLRKEKEELRYALFDKISCVKNNADLKDILKKVDAVKQLLDIHDSPLENALDDICLCFSTSLLQKVKKSINDILDDYDKIDKKGNPVYSESEKTAVFQMIEDINNICNRNFWDRFANVLKGS